MHLLAVPIALYLGMTVGPAIWAVIKWPIVAFFFYNSYIVIRDRNKESK